MYCMYFFVRNKDDRMVSSVFLFLDGLSQQLEAPFSSATLSWVPIAVSNVVLLIFLMIVGETVMAVRSVFD